MMKDLFVFANSVSIDGRLCINIDEKGIVEIIYNDKSCYVDTSVLNNWSTTCVLFNQLNDSLFTVYNYHEMCKLQNLTHSEMLKMACVNCFMQIDKKNGKLFSKIFLPYNQFTLESDKNDFSENLYLTKDFIHPLDWQYMWTFELLKLEKADDLLNGTIDIAPSCLGGTLFINYAGQIQQILPGENQFSFKFVKGENLFLGEPYARYKGQMIEVEKALL